MVQHVDPDAICIWLFEIPADYFDFEGEVDVGAVFEWDLHDALAGDLDYLHSSGSILQFLQANYLRDFSLALYGHDQGGQFIDLQLQYTVDISRHLQFWYAGSDEDGHGFSILDRQLHLCYFLPIFHSLDGKDLLEIEFFAIGEGMHLGPDLDHMELPTLSFVEVVHEFCDEGELFEGGGEDGVLAEVYLVLVDLEAFAGLEEGEGAPGTTFLLGLFLHAADYNLMFKSITIENQEAGNNG